MKKTAVGPMTLLYPKPALLIGANIDGKPNFMTVAWAGIANQSPPMLSVVSAFLKTCSKARNLRILKLTEGWNRRPPL